MTAKRVAKKPPPRRRPSPKEDGAKRVKVAAAKGRPMLTWVGKRPLSHVTAFPAQHVETFDPTGELDKPRTDDVWADWPEKYPKGGLLFHGDNKDVLAHLLANGFRGKIDLIYIDPPFDSGADYVRRVSLRGPRGTVKIEGEGYTLGEQLQYTDIWANDEYLQFMYERLLLIREMLSEKYGTLFLHCDNRKMHLLRSLLDEVFGPEAFVNEIVWVHQIMGGSHEKRFSKAHETLLWYSKGDAYALQSEDPHVRIPYSEYVRKTMKQDEEGQWYYERRRMSRKATAEERASKAHTRTYVEDPEEGTVATDVWLDMLSYQETPDEREGLDLYPTQKTTDLLTRIIASASRPGDLVLDCFSGSGVVAKVAQLMGRRWIVCDINIGALQTTAARLQTVIHSQTDVQGQGSLTDGGVTPCQHAYTSWTVNDYDLVIAHEEAAALACEHLGVQRTRTDPYFDGTFGRALVKIVSFTHPLSPLDLERLRQELDARPNEDRAVTVVCLGIELAAQKWIEAWNKRPGRKSVNKIDVIELRSDPRYGGLIRHEPAKARVNIARSKDKIVVVIEDFISPTIIERLAQQTGIVKPKIDDWRQMVDCVMVDPTYDGSVFDIAVSDVPAKKNDFVDGRYELPAPKGKTTVAVKIIDMLGEEVLTTADV